MKILLLSPLPPPAGGIASWTSNLLDYIKKAEPAIQIDHQNTAIKYRRITDYGIFSRIFWGCAELFRIATSIVGNLKNNPDVVHLTSSASLGLFKDYFIICICRLKKVPIIIHWRFGRIPDLKASRNWEWLLLKFIVKKASGSIVIDQKSFEVLDNEGLKNIYKMPNPISFEVEVLARNIIKNEINIRIEKRVVLFVGYVIKGKGIFELVEACGRFEEIEELRIVGPYEEREKNALESLARKFKSGDNRWITFLGQLEIRDVLSEMSSAQILALPSYTEGFPNVIIEGMAMGCTLVASNVGAIPEILDYRGEPCGLIISPKSVSELITAFQEVINNPTLSERLSNNARSKVLQEYTMKTAVANYSLLWAQFENRSKRK